jgi:hypothetical protein
LIISGEPLTVALICPHKSNSDSDTLHPGYCIANFFHTIFTLAALAWVIIGTIWISDMSYYHHYCQNDLYIFTLAMIIVQWAFVLISLVLSCCAHSRRRKAST